MLLFYTIAHIIEKGRDIRMVEIKYMVEKRIIDEAIKCDREFQCLSGNEECLCPVEDTIEENILFIHSPKGNFCPYRMSFGYSFICGCPVRKYLFLKYKI